MSRLPNYRKVALVLVAIAAVVLAIVGIDAFLRHRAAEQARDLLVGKWEVTGEDAVSSLEFRADGTMRRVSAYQLPTETFDPWVTGAATVVALAILLSLRVALHWDRAVVLRLGRLHALRDQIFSRRAVFGDRTRRGNVIGGYGVAQHCQHAR